MRRGRNDRKPIMTLTAKEECRVMRKQKENEELDKHASGCVEVYLVGWLFLLLLLM